MATTKESEQEAGSKKNHNNSKKKSSKKNVTISEEDGSSQACADKPTINHSEKEAKLLSSSLVFKCDQCNFTSNFDKGLKVHTRMKHHISQRDGNEEEVDKPETVNKHTDEEKETQTDIFLKLDQDGGVFNSFLNILHYNLPPTVYHPVSGIGEYHSTDNYKECQTNKNRKAHCYRFGNGILIDVC